MKNKKVDLKMWRNEGKYKLKHIFKEPVNDKLILGFECIQLVHLID